ncbi:AMP-binding protein [Streptomyces thinghirensis]|nr:AMP-binding protein [Streptomyces thinghirensis]
MVQDLNLRTDPDTSRVFQVSYVFQNQRMMRLTEDDVRGLDLARSLRFVENIPGGSSSSTWRSSSTPPTPTPAPEVRRRAVRRRGRQASSSATTRPCCAPSSTPRSSGFRSLAPVGGRGPPVRRVERHRPALLRGPQPARPPRRRRRPPRRPHALVYGERSLTYTELAARTDTLAAELCRRGVADTVVGISMERSMEMVIALWAVRRRAAPTSPGAGLPGRADPVHDRGLGCRPGPHPVPSGVSR